MTTTRQELISRHMSAGMGAKVTDEQSDALDQIREAWELLTPEIRKELLAELIRKL